MIGYLHVCSSSAVSLTVEALLCSDWLADSGALTVVAGQAPAAGHTPHASGEVVSGLSHTHGGNTHAHLSGAGQLDEQDVVVDGVAVVVGVLENLTGNDIIVSGGHTQRHSDETRHRRCLSPTFPTFMTWMASELEERSCSPRITRWDVLQGNGWKHRVAILCQKHLLTGDD